MAKKKRKTAKKRRRGKARKKSAAKKPSRDPAGRFAKKKSRKPSSVSSVPPARPGRAGGRSSPSSPAAVTKRRHALARHLRGEHLTTHQMKLVCDFLRPLFTRCPQKLVKEILDTSRSALSQWEKDGAPRNADGTWPLSGTKKAPGLIAWLKAKWKKGHGQLELPLAEDWDARLRKAKALNQERLNATAEGSQISRDLAQALFGEMADVLILSLKRLPELAGELAGRTETQARARLVAFHDQARSELSSMAARCGGELDPVSHVKEGKA